MPLTANKELKNLTTKPLVLYAKFLRDNYLEEFVLKQLELSRGLDIPLLKHFESWSEADLIDLSKKNMWDILTLLSEGKIDEQIQRSLKQWVSDQLPVVGRYQIIADDITLLSYIRKQTFIHFLPLYTSDLTASLEIITGIDNYILKLESASIKTFTQLLEEKIYDEVLFNKKITFTTPSIIYILDRIELKEVYANKRINEFLGYTHEELQSLGNTLLNTILHPEDIDKATSHLKDFSTAQDEEIRTYEYRLKDKKGIYHWVRTYQTIFKRTEEGVPWHIMGIAIPIDDEKEKEKKLIHREEQLLEAQELAEMGSYEWYLDNWSGEVTPQVLKILELKKEDNLDGFIKKIHPSDRPRVTQELERIKSKGGTFDGEYRYYASGIEKVIWSKGSLLFHHGRPLLKGTVMDITARHHIIKRLQRSEELYKQAQALAHIGNYTWDLKSNTIHWTDELYLIYGLEPSSKNMTPEMITSFNHPDDTEQTKVIIQQSIQNHQPYDFYYRIILRDGKIKTLHARGEILVDENNEAYKVIGTTQDVTERQELIERLQQSEKLYKQAQAISHIGNWTYYIHEDKIVWSDELYRIFGLDPASEITYQQYMEMLYPADAGVIAFHVQECIDKHKPYETFHRIIRKDGQVRHIHGRGNVELDKDGKAFKLYGTAQDVTERQILIDRLRKSEELYKQAQAISHIGNWTYELSENKITWTDELFRIYDIDPHSELTWETFKGLIHPEDVNLVEQTLLQIRSDHEPFEIFHRTITSKGKTKILNVKGEIITNKMGEPIRLFGTTQDVTAQKMIEKKLIENQNFIHKIADATPSIISAYNIQTAMYSFINKGMKALLGYEPSEVMEKGIEFIIDKIHPDDLQPLLEKNDTRIAEANLGSNKNKEIITEFKYRIRHANGQYRWLHTYGTIFERDEQEKVKSILNISLDITDQIEADLIIQEQEHFIQHIADASPTVIYLYDIELQRIVYINREITTVLGYLPNEILAMDKAQIRQLYHSEDIEKLGELRKQHPKDTMGEFECRMMTKNNSWCWLLIREVVFKRNMEGKPNQLLGAALDISARKEMERALNQKTFQLEQSNASLEEFAYVASHDLKEPLRKISTFGERLLTTQQDKLTPDGQLYLNKIIGSSRRMQSMISDLLSISKISGNRSFEPYNLQLLLEDVLQTLEFQIEKKNAVIQSDGLPVAMVVASQIRQLFQNLLSNSLKFSASEKQPLIEITHRYLNSSEVEKLNLGKAKQYLQINFKDNGIGFDNQYAGKIFAIFQRLHGKSEYEGTGIGLTICKRIVENHEGVIFAQGKVKDGATFTIIIPL